MLSMLLLDVTTSIGWLIASLKNFRNKKHPQKKLNKLEKKSRTTLKTLSISVNSLIYQIQRTKEDETKLL